MSSEANPAAAFRVLGLGAGLEQDSGTKTFSYREPHKTQTSSAHNLKKENKCSVKKKEEEKVHRSLRRSDRRRRTGGGAYRPGWGVDCGTGRGRRSLQTDWTWVGSDRISRVTFSVSMTTENDHQPDGTRVRRPPFDGLGGGGTSGSVGARPERDGTGHMTLGYRI